MLAIKFKRTGKKHQPSYRIIVIEKRHKIFGRFVEDLGWMDPKTEKAEIKKDRAKYWVSVGAQPTDSIHNLFVKEGVLEGKKIPVHKKPKKEETKAESAPAAPVAAAAAHPAPAAGSAEVSVAPAAEVSPEASA
ncbi:30S ribosomal protein S16 [Patescibacteria group bacterium]|nr:30S ribosomal protein S16 [Patescibacteria group bacterium]